MSDKEDAPRGGGGAGGAGRPHYDMADFSATSAPSSVSGLDEQPLQPPKLRFPQRWVLACVAFFGFFNVYAMRVNLSVAVVDMRKEFHWTHAQKGLVLGSFFMGYFFTQIPGGWVAARYGGKYVFGIGVLITSILTLVTPIVSSNYHLLLAVRVLEGIGEGVTFPAMHSIWSRWAPPLERSKLATFTYAGAYLGTVIAFPVSGILCKHATFVGKHYWHAVFYTLGMVGVVWFVLWTFLAFNSPEEHPWITEEEKTYIVESIRRQKPEKTGDKTGGDDAKSTAGSRVGKGSVNGDLEQPLLDGDEEMCADAYDNDRPPWGHLFTSLPVLAITTAHFCNNWGFYMLLTCLPSYLTSVLDFNIQHAGFDSSLPYLSIFIVALIAGRVADYLRDVKRMRTTVVRKVMTVLSLPLAAGFLVLAGYSPTSGAKGKHLAVMWLSLAVGSLGIGNAGWNVNHLDVAPRYAGVLMGITNTVATIPGFAAPALVNHIATSEDPNKLREQWRLIFWIAAIVNLSGALFYLYAAAGRKQYWADMKGKRLSCFRQPGEEDEQDAHLRTGLPTGPSGRLG